MAIEYHLGIAGVNRLGKMLLPSMIRIPLNSDKGRDMWKICMVTLSVMVLHAVAWGMEDIGITSPTNRSTVSNRETVLVRSPGDVVKIWVVIHPVETGDYWVQPEVMKTEAKAWKVEAYFGRVGTIDADKKFEIMAIGDPRINLKKGDVFKSWPKGRWQSQVIGVVRR